MSAWRFAIGFLTVALFLFSTVIALQPVRHAGSAGLGTRSQTPQSPSWLVLNVDSGGPAANAGIRTGDVIGAPVPDSIGGRLACVFPTVGTACAREISRAGVSRVVTMRFNEPAPPAPLWAVVLTLSMNSLYAILAVLLVARAFERREARIVIGFLLASLTNNIPYYMFAPAPLLTFIGASVANASAILVFYFPLRLVTIVPPRESKTKRWVERITPFAVAAVALSSTYTLIAPIVPAIASSGYGIWIALHFSSWIPELLFIGLVVIATFDALASADVTYRAQVQWIASTLIAGLALETARGLCFLFLPGGSPGWFETIANPLESIGAFGAAYAVLRHRLVDVRFVLSRAAIFAIVSAALLAIFVAAEWLAGKIAESTFGDSLHGIPAQATSLAIAIGIGLSVRFIHSKAEYFVNATLFRKRRRDEGELRRFAREAEVATDADQLLSAAFETMRKHVECSYVALFVQQGARYVRVHSSTEAPASAGENDPLILRLRRFGEPFEVDDRDSAFNHAMFFPMTILRRVVAFAVCGPKVDRTHFAGDEVETLTLFSHRVGTAYAWLREHRNGQDE